MIEKITVIKSMPGWGIGEVVYRRGTQYGKDGAHFGEISGPYYTLDRAARESGDWVEIEPTALPDGRPHLSVLLGKTLYTLREALDLLGWTYDWGEDGATNIRCCGEKVHLEGFITPDRGGCEKCPKRLYDETGLQWAGHASMAMVGVNHYQCDDKRRWSIHTGEQDAATGRKETA